MKFKELSVYLDKLDQTASRIAITEILSDLFKKSDSREIDKVVYLLLGGLAPKFESVVFNLAERMLLTTVADAYSKDLAEVKLMYKKAGDIGDVAESLAKSSGGNLSVSKVFDELYKLAVDEGEGSVERKVKALSKILSKLDGKSAKFVARMTLGKLRLGFSDKTILDALSWMEKGDKSAKAEIEKAYEVLPDVGKLAQQIKEKGVKGISKNPTPIVGIPVMPMLAQRLKSPTEMIEKMGEVSVEPKFDGLRALIHYSSKNGIKVFTRNLNEVSDMFPEIKNLNKYIKADEAILDSEAVGLDPKTERMVDFQKTIQRRRKHDVESTSRDIPMRFQVFDVIMKDGKSFMNEPYRKRRKILEKLFTKNKLFVVDENWITDDAEFIRRKHEELLSEGLEGVIVKKLDSTYVPGRTGWRWVKMKEVESSHAKLADTVDAVVMGYTQGKGKRVKFGVGQFLAGIRVDGEYKSITKVGTGLTDDQFRELKKRLNKITVKNKPRQFNVIKDLEPDFWVDPKLVVELAADEVTKSPRHTSGYALRFPRLIKFRDDKSADQATTLKEIIKLFKLQK